VPGSVASSDGDRQFVPARELARLYGVPFEQCIVYCPANIGVKLRPLVGDVCLYPDPAGRYELPQQAKDLLT